ECGYRQGVSFLSAYLGLNVVYKVNNVLSSLGNYLVVKSFILAAGPGSGNLYLVNALSARVDSSPVLHNYVLALTAVGSLCSGLHQLIGLLCRDNAGQLEECGLKDGVDTGRAHAGL